MYGPLDGLYLRIESSGWSYASVNKKVLRAGPNFSGVRRLISGGSCMYSRGAEMAKLLSENLYRPRPVSTLVVRGCVG